MKKIKIALCQLNVKVGDISGNYDKILKNYQKANDNNCDIIIFPELAISGYDCQDLLQKKHFIADIKEKILQLCQISKGKNCAIIIGSPTAAIVKNKEQIFNSAIIIKDGKISEIANKKNLINERVFDEERYFSASKYLSYPILKGFNINVLICEDLWHPINATLASQQIFDFTIAINASPFSVNKDIKRQEIASNYSKITNKNLIYCNLVGGQDELVFDGNSFIINNNQQIIAKLAQFEEDFQIFEVTKDNDNILISNKEQQITKSQDQTSQIYNALILGLRDYVTKNNFKEVIIGMSGGIDSAICATIAVDALGPKNVKLYALPSQYNSKTSMQDALSCAKNLNVKLEIIEIENIVKEINKSLGQVNDLTKQNIQSRVRGNILMSLSNNNNALLLTTGNKSELAVGYCTIYGDMCGAFNPIKDIYKTQIYQLAKWRNDNIANLSLHKHKNLIPQNIITKEPSAELAPNQKDSDSLGQYDILDQILNLLIEEQKSINEVIELGFDKNIVKKVANLILTSEYKRHQSALGPKISKMSFGRDRRYPITNGFKL